MRKPLLRLILFIIFLFTCIAAKAQQNSFTNQDSVKKDSVYKARFNKKAKGIYADGLGPGGLYSINYDTRFSKKQNGLGGRIGFSYLSAVGERAVTFPVVINYLFGKKGRYLEVGAGATYYRYHSDYYGTFFKKRRDSYYDQINPGDNDPVFDYNSPTIENSIIFSINVGFRYQPLKEGGVIFRVGMSPLFNGDRILPYWPYAGFGFKLDSKPKKTNKLK